MSSIASKPVAPILVIEDEEHLAKSVQQQLTRAGYEVEIAFNGLLAAEKLRAAQYALVILDLGLPGKNGIDVLADLRRALNPVPVLIVSACVTVAERVRGLNLGADDYLVKPFDSSELLARVQALLRRTEQPESNMLRAADLIMDVIRRTVCRAGKEIHLSPREFSLLYYLLRNKNRLVSRQQITEQVWGYGFDTGTNIVDVYINYVRKAVDEGFSRNLILTVHGKGFILMDS